jgi:hypothetical protein
VSLPFLLRCLRLLRSPSLFSFAQLENLLRRTILAVALLLIVPEIGAA